MKRIVCFHSDVDFGVATHLLDAPQQHVATTLGTYWRAINKCLSGEQVSRHTKVNI